MITTSFAEILTTMLSRNASIATAYRDASKRLLSRSSSSLATSAAEQRREFGEELASLSASIDPKLRELRVELPDEFTQMKISLPETRDDGQALIAFLRDTESIEKRLYAALAQAAAPLDPDTAARFNAFSEQAHKREAVAAGHIDLLALH